MSVIYGIVMLNNQPVNPEMLNTMKRAMDFWGPDGQGQWHEGPAALGNLLLYNTPESVFEKMPFTDPSGDLIFTASARIDNRSELCRLFRITPQEAMKLPDSYFIMRAYQRWGEDCPDHLLGDWSFAVWNRKTQRMFIARDHHGITALYYHKGKDFFVFSSSLKGILCLKEVEKKVNEEKVAQILVGWNEGGPKTCYQGIFRLPPAHTLVLQNQKLESKRYWFLEETPELRLPEEQQYVDLFMDIYTEAVKCRLRSYKPVGATLSGGLDSGSVCALASKELKKEGKRLQAFTAVPLYDTAGLVPPNRIGDEGPLAKELSDFCGNIEIEFCNSKEIDPIHGAEMILEIGAEPIHGFVNAYWIIDLIKSAKKKDIGSLLIAQGGNSTISWPLKNPLKKGKIHFKSLILVKQICLSILNSWIYIIGFKSLKQEQFNLIGPRTSKYMTWINLSTVHKISISDPTFDKEILVLTISTPDKLYYSRERFYVLCGFCKILPDNILKNDKRGIQAGDFSRRVELANVSVDKKQFKKYFVNKFIQRWETR